MEPSRGGRSTDDLGDTEAPSGLSTVLTPAVLIATVPGIGYVVAWVHEYAFSRTFNVPVELIAPQLSSVLVATGLLFAFLIFWMMVLDMYYGLRKPGPLGPIELRVLILAASLIPALLFGVVRLTLGNWDGVLVLGIVAFYAANELLLPAILDRQGSYLDRMRRYAERASQTP